MLFVSQIRSLEWSQTNKESQQVAVAGLVRVTGARDWAVIE